MTAKPSSSPCQPTALGRRFRTTVSALALSALIGLGAASTSQAAVGSVYFDANDNAAAGETLFNGTFTGIGNVGLGRSVMPNLTTGSTTSPPDRACLITTASKRRHRHQRAVRQHDRQRQRRQHGVSRQRRAGSPTRPASTRQHGHRQCRTAHALRQHHRLRQRRHRHDALARTPPATTTSPPAPARCTPTRTGINNVATRHRRR